MTNIYRNKINFGGMVAVFSLLSVAPAVAACNSGPDYCTDEPRIAPLLAEKKARLSEEYPARLVSLLDRGVQCVARIEKSPDGFTLIIVGDDATTALEGSQDNEDAAKKQVAAGTLKRYWVVHLRQAFQCDGEKPYSERDDYDATDDLNTSLAIACSPTKKC